MRDDKVLGSTVRIDLTTHDSTGALVAPSSAFASDGSDFRIYKDGSAAQKTTQNGITVTSPFDSIVGKHLIEIDTSNSTGDSGFWAAGSEYRVEINSAKTISGIVQSGVVVGRFALVAAGVLRPTTDGRTLDVSVDHEALAVLDSSVTTQLQSIEDGVDANTGYLTSVLARIGSFAGTGVNNILGMFRALFRSDASTPSDMGGTATAADHSLQAVRVRGDAAWITGSGSGTGARVVTVTVNDGTSPLQNAVVRMAEGSNSYTATTNASGVATFNLNDATYTVSIGKDGYSYDGTTLVVNGTETVTYSMTAISVTPSTGNFTTAYLTVFGRDGAVSAGTTVKLQIVRLGTSYSGAAYNGEIRSEVSGVDGVVQFLNVPKDSEILYWIGEKKTKSTTSISSTAGSTYALPSIVSAP